MRTSIAVLCLSVLFGCASTPNRELYAEYGRIQLEKPIPDDIVVDSQRLTKRRDERRKLSDVSEGFGVELDTDGSVRAKWYRINPERVVLPILWYFHTSRYERELTVPADLKASGDDRRIAAHLIHACDRSAEETRLLTRAADGEAFSQRLPRFTSAHLVHVFPGWERSTSTLQRTSDATYRISVETESNISMVVWTVIGYGAMLIGKFP